MYSWIRCKEDKLQFHFLACVSSHLSLEKINITEIKLNDQFVNIFTRGNLAPCRAFSLTVPKAPPSNVTAEPHSTTSIKVTWQPVDECKRNGKITEYRVEVYNSSLDEIDFANVSGTTYSVEVKGLQEYTNYSARVQAYTSIGEGPFSKYRNTTTHQPGMQKEKSMLAS